MSEIDPSARPSLAPHARLQVDRVSGDPVLLYPEGILQLNETSAAILRECDGVATLEEILARLAEKFDAPEDELRGDVLEFLRDLQGRRLLRL